MAKEYIERETLKEDLKESYERLRAIYDSLTYNEDKQICAGQLTTFTEAILRVKEAPAADVVEVVRCRECKYSHEDEIFGNRWCDSHLGCRKVKDDGYCYLGELKEGAGNEP